MTKKRKIEKKRIWVIAVAAVLVAVVLIIVFVINGGKKELGDDYFVNDGSKYVSLVDNEDDGILFNKTPLKVWAVYYYSDGMVTDVKKYYEFTSEEDAKNSLEQYRQDMTEVGMEDDIANTEANGRYVVETIEPYLYYGMSEADAASFVKEAK